MVLRIIARVTSLDWHWRNCLAGYLPQILVMAEEAEEEEEEEETQGTAAQGSANDQTCRWSDG